MIRALALAQWVVITMGVVTMALFAKSGVLETRPEWARYIATHSSFWLMLVPLFYAGICEFAQRYLSSKPLLILTQTLGIGLLVVFILLFGSVIFYF